MMKQQSVELVFYSHHHVAQQQQQEGQYQSSTVLTRKKSSYQCHNLQTMVRIMYYFKFIVTNTSVQRTSMFDY